MLRLLCLFCLWLGLHLSVAAAPPNIIFILSDDLAQGDLGCYGQKLIKTPNLDRMAAEGTRYLQAYCGTSVCAPSRTSLMTGLHDGALAGAGESRDQTRGTISTARGDADGGAGAEERGLRDGLHGQAPRSSPKRKR